MPDLQPSGALLSQIANPQTGGFDVGKFLQFQQMQMRMMQLKELQNAENAMRSIYGNPANFDAQGIPKPASLGPLIQASPQMGMDLMSQIATQKEHAARTDALNTEAYTKSQEKAAEIGKGALKYYQSSLDSGIDPQRAMQQTQGYVSDQLAQAKAGGFKFLDKFPANFNPVEYRKMDASWDAGKAKPAQPITPLQAMREGREQEVATSTIQHQRALEDAARKRAEKTGGEKLAPSKEIAIVDKDGNVVERFAARETSTQPELGHSGYFRSSSGEEVVVPAGGKIDVGQAAGAVIGSRENVYIGRILEGGITATADLENISKMPLTVTSGLYRHSAGIGGY